MLKTQSSLPWKCTRCIRQRRIFPRFLHSSSFHHEDNRPVRRVSEQISAPYHTGSSSTRHDDRTLREIFDSPALWNEFSQHSKASSTGRSHGLFQNKYLTGPEGFERFAHTSLRKAKKIVDRVLTAQTKEEYRGVVRQLDRLSDLLCRVIDLADFVRATHPDARIQAAATSCHSMMYEYMNVLNATTGLSDQLNIAMSDESATWGEEEKMVGKILQRDFSKSAIHLPQQKKDRFVSLSQDINNVGSSFAESMAPAEPYLVFDSAQLQGMDPLLMRDFSTHIGKRIFLPTVGMPSLMALRTVHDPKIRKEIFIASRTASKPTIDKLETMIKKRSELAILVGYESYLHMALEDKMLNHPSAVQNFLSQVSQNNEVPMITQLHQLRYTKCRYIDAQFSLSPQTAIEPWDKEYYMAKEHQDSHSKTRRPDFLSSYFSLGTVMQGLSRLFSRLYGVRLVPHNSMPGETWNADVRRLNVVSESEGLVAVLYCDLFAREGKSPNPAHFTLRCSRFISDEEIHESRQAHDPIFNSPQEAANDGMAFSDKGPKGGIMQLPTIALICDFAVASNLRRPALLSFSEVTTLFHEMGHALHSILGRTQFQNVSGTRVATDFAELPSILMEHFAADKDVLSLFARHYETDEPLPYEMITEQLAFEKKFDAFDVDNQITLSFLDQSVHSVAASQASFNSTKLYHDVQRQHSQLPPDPPETCWQGFFGHLFGYGGTYYSYLFDRVLARRIWGSVFNSGHQRGAITQEHGERFQSEVLQWGGGRDPWDCLSRATGDPRLSKDSDPVERARSIAHGGLRKSRHSKS
jgi:intermediate peptidase